MWSNASNNGSRNISAPVPRNQGTPLSTQTGQDELFSPPAGRMASQQGSFRFGNQGSVPSSSQPTQQNAVDEFPPLNRNGSAEMDPERMSSLGFGSQAGPVPGAAQSNRGNGLLNALSANSRASEARSPPGIGAPGKDVSLTESYVFRVCLLTVFKCLRDKKRTTARIKDYQLARISLASSSRAQMQSRMRTGILNRLTVSIFWLGCPRRTNGASRGCGR